MSRVRAQRLLSNAAPRASRTCLHNLGDPGDRAAALDEPFRVLRPGGRVVRLLVAVSTADHAAPAE